MISRQWCGLAKPEYADRYVAHLRSETFPQLERIPGFVTASLFKRELPEGTEFLVVTQWMSMAAIETFAGPASHVAVVPDVVKPMMIEYDDQVRHYVVVE